MARYGSERIRGHGIPEAIESILHRGQPRRAARRAPEAALVGDLDRLGRPVRRRGSDHHDGRRVRLDDRAALPPHERRAQDAARRGRGRRHVGDVRGADRGGAARGRAAALRVEAAQLRSRSRSRAPPRRAARRYLLGAGPLFPVPPHADASSVRRARLRASLAGLLAGVLSALLTLSGLRGEDRFREAADPLDVVARARRPRRRPRRARSTRARSASATTSSSDCSAATLVGTTLARARRS